MYDWVGGWVGKALMGGWVGGWVDVPRMDAFLPLGVWRSAPACPSFLQVKETPGRGGWVGGWVGRWMGGWVGGGLCLLDLVSSCR